MEMAMEVVVLVLGLWPQYFHKMNKVTIKSLHFKHTSSLDESSPGDGGRTDPDCKQQNKR